MNANAELLNYVYQNSQMGVDTLSRFLEMTEDVSFREVLKKQMEGYWRFHKRAGDMLNDNGFDEKGLNAMEKIRTYLMIKVKTMTGQSSSNIPGMLINGSILLHEHQIHFPEYQLHLLHEVIYQRTPMKSFYPVSLTQVPHMEVQYRILYVT